MLIEIWADRYLFHLNIEHCFTKVKKKEKKNSKNMKRKALSSFATLKKNHLRDHEISKL